MSCTGILLAAGRGRRFDSTGTHNKLLQQLPNGEIVVLQAARRLVQVLPDTLVVVSSKERELLALLQQAGLRTAVCPDATAGIGDSLAHAIGLTSTASGWVIALADMPYVQPATIAALHYALCAGADIAAPVMLGRRGNPVGFGGRHRAALLRLRGDQGARALLDTCPVTSVEVDDSGIFMDIDTPDDLLTEPTL